MKPEFETYIRERFAGARVNEDPFPHLVIRDVLPPALYAEMKICLPTSQKWMLAALADSLSEKRQRLGLPLALAGLARSYVKRTLMQPMFALRPDNQTSAVLSTYSDRWIKRFRLYIDLVDDLTAHAFAPHLNGTTKRGQSVFCRRIEWAISPHVHDRQQSIQSMIYFAKDDTAPERGTILYRPKRGGEVPSLSDRTVHVDASRLEQVTVMPYYPNTLASFVNIEHSFHSPPLTAGSARDYVFTGSLWA
jgi:hypothetical protein